MRIVAVTNDKGGVGKTTIAVNLAATLAATEPTLLIDLDPIGAAFYCTGLNPDPDEPTIKDTFDLGAPLASLVRETAVPGLSVIPVGASLRDLDHIQSDPLVLSRALIELAASPNPPAWVIIDCAPGYDIATRNARAAADVFLVPVEPDALAMLGVGSLLEGLRRDHPQTDFRLVLNGTDSSATAEKRLTAYFNEMPTLPTRIPRSAAMRTSQTPDPATGLVRPAVVHSASSWRILPIFTSLANDLRQWTGAALV